MYDVDALPGADVALVFNCKCIYNLASHSSPAGCMQALAVSVSRLVLLLYCGLCDMAGAPSFVPSMRLAQLKGIWPVVPHQCIV